MSLKQTLSRPPTVYSSPDFLRVIEDHKTILQSSSSVLPFEVSVGLRFVNNFYGLLNFLGIAPRYWIPTLRINGFSSAEEFDGQLSILRCSEAEIDSILRLFQTKEKNLF